MKPERKVEASVCKSWFWILEDFSLTWTIFLIGVNSWDSLSLSFNSNESMGPATRTASSTSPCCQTPARLTSFPAGACRLPRLCTPASLSPPSVPRSWSQGPSSSGAIWLLVCGVVQSTSDWSFILVWLRSPCWTPSLAHPPCPSAPTLGCFLSVFQEG